MSNSPTGASWQTTHQTSPKAPMPTGCRSEYLRSPLAHAVPSGARRPLLLPVPARDLKGGAKNLGTHEFRHFEGVARMAGRSREVARMKSGCGSGSGCEVGVGGGLSRLGRLVWGWLLSQWRQQARLDKLLFTADERNELWVRRTGAVCREMFATDLVFGDCRCCSRRGLSARERRSGPDDLSVCRYAGWQLACPGGAGRRLCVCVGWAVVRAAARGRGQVAVLMEEGRGAEEGGRDNRLRWRVGFGGKNMGIVV